MGVCFALRRRDWKQLLLDRAKRILLPLIFGSFLIVPIHVYIFQNYYDQAIAYSPSTGHLWFLANICIYVTQIIGFAFLEKNYNYKFFNFFRDQLKRPYLIYLFIIPFVLEAELMNPDYFATYFGNAHGFMIGMFAFFFGFLFVAIGNVFWDAVEKLKYVSLIVAFTLYLIRLIYFELNPPHYLSSIESMNWIFAIFGFGYKYLNKPSKLLSELSQAAYPVYIVHMIFLYLAAYLILPLKLSLAVNLILIILLSFTGCYISYEVIKRIEILRPFFGLKSLRKPVIYNE